MIKKYRKSFNLHLMMVSGKKKRKNKNVNFGEKIIKTEIKMTRN